MSKKTITQLEKAGVKRFDITKKPIKPTWYLKLLVGIISPFYNLFSNSRVKTEKEVKKLKGPYLILSTHASFIDFPQVAQGIAPRTTNWVMSVEEMRRGDWLMVGVGGIAKRKFTHDVSTTKNIMYCIKKLKQSCCLFPEARFEFAGINEKLDGALGKLCKVLDVPVVMCMTNGNFLNSPQWAKHPYKNIRQEAHLYQLFSLEEVRNSSAEELQAKIEKAFEKDEYKWQVENNLHITNKERAKGIHRILYKCPVCGKEFEMDSAGIHLWCNACGAMWEMDTLSRLHGVNTDKGFEHVPDWYRWERSEVEKEVINGTYHFEDEIRIEEYYNNKECFVYGGDGKVVHDQNGFTITGEIDGKPFEINKPVASMYSVHVEYDFLGRGDAFDIATTHNSYFMYLKNAKNYLTKMHFATEALYDHYVTKKI